MEGPPAALLLGQVVPDFEQDSSHGPIKFHEFIGDSWCLLVSHPADYTPVCTTELSELAKLDESAFKARGCKVIALSVDSAEDHKGWSKDVEAYGGDGTSIKYPIIADKDRKVARLYNMLPAEEAPGMPMTVRSVFIIGPDKKLKLSITYPPSTGRNFDEIIRVLDSLQLTAGKGLATPVNWKKGDKCVISPAINNEAANEKFPGYETLTLPSGKPYLRMTDKY